MATDKAAALDQTRLSAWRRNYRLSLAALAVGVVLVVVVSAVSSWANSARSISTSGGSGLAIQVVGTAGGMLLIVGGIFAFHNRSLVQQNQRID